MDHSVQEVSTVIYCKSINDLQVFMIVSWIRQYESLSQKEMLKYF